MAFARESSSALWHDAVTIMPSGTGVAGENQRGQWTPSAPTAQASSASAPTISFTPRGAQTAFSRAASPALPLIR